MIIKPHLGVAVGDYIRPYGHNVSRNQKWWKVVDTAGPRRDTLIVVDRHRYEREFHWRQGRKYQVWEPGDPRDDGPID